MTEPSDAVHYPRWTDEAADRVRALSGQWLEAAERAFGGSVSDPVRYQRVALAVGAMHRRLRELGPGPVVLADAWDRLDDLLRELTAGGPQPGLEGPQGRAAAGAAFAMRYPEVLAEVAADRRLARLRAAEAQAGWVVLEESGYSPGDPFVAYRRLEAESREGRALLVSTRPDDTFSTVLHEVSEGVVDLDSGELRWPAGAVVHAFADEAAREAHVVTARAAERPVDPD